MNVKIEFVRMERAGKALAKLKLSDAITPDELALAAWTAAVGERIAAHAAPKALVRGCLVVEAEDGTWQRQLFQLRHAILAKIGDLIGNGTVTDLEFRIARSTPRRPPQPAQAHGENAGLDEADGIQDPVLRIVYKQARRKTQKRAGA